jgi:hypothetical protein
MNTNTVPKFTRQTFGSGIDCWNVNCSSEVGDLLTQLKGEQHSTIAANVGKVALTVPGFAMDTEDLFGHAPLDIRKDNAMHVSNVDYSAKYFVELCLWASKDCGLFIHSNQPAEKLKETKKIYWAWFSKPSILLHQAKAGSKDLAEKLFSELEMVILIQTMTPTEASLIILAPASAAANVEKILGN